MKKVTKIKLGDQDQRKRGIKAINNHNKKRAEKNNSFHKLWAILTLVLIQCQHLMGSIPRCNTGLFSTSKTFTGVAFDPGKVQVALPCQKKSQNIRLSVLVKVTGAPGGLGSVGYVFDFFPGVSIQVKKRSGTAESDFQFMYMVTTQLSKQVVYNEWAFIWYEISGADVRLAFRTGPDFSTQDANNFQTTLSGASQVRVQDYSGMGIGGIYLAPTIWQSVKGTVSTASASCNTLGFNYLSKTWLLMMLTMRSHLKAYYLVDEDKQFFANLIDPSTKQPYLYRGSDETVEEADPVKNGNRLEVRSGTKYSIGDVRLEILSTELIKVVTFVVRLKILALPPAGKKEPLVSLISRKSFSLMIDHAGVLSLTDCGGSSTFSTTLSLTLNNFHYVKVAIGRFDIPNYDSAWSVAVDTKASEQGGTMTWDSLADTPLKAIDIWCFEIGGSTLIGGTLNFEVSMASVHKGAFMFRGFSELPCYNENTNAHNPCKLEALGATDQVCFDCYTGGGAKWIINPTTGGILCHSSATAPSQTLQKTGSFYHPQMYSSCGAGLYYSSSACQSCDSSCAVCSGPTSSNCEQCLWSKFQYAPSGGGTCLSCAVTAGKYMVYGDCLDCSVAFCNKCVYNEGCQECAGTRVFGNNLCCDINNGQFVNTGNSPATCENCHSSCKRCDGTASNNCLECYETGIFISGSKTCLFCDINNAKYISGTSCLSCATHCLKCSDGSTCTQCAPNYVIVSGTCTFCDSSAGKWINTANTPPTCDVCGTNCQACPNSNSCSTCTANHVPANDGTANCVPCDVNNGKFVNTGNSPPTCDSCGNNCKVCPGTTSCSTCQSSYVPVGGGSGDCSFCDQSNGKWINTGNTPPTCDACGNNCKVCSALNSCTQCQPSFYIHLGTPGECQPCDKLNSQWIDSSTSPASCKSCGTSCLECPNTLSCSKCQPSYVPLGGGSGGCQLCETSQAKFIDTSSSPSTCKDCQTGCLACTSLNQCSSCDTLNFYKKYNSKCYLCNFSLNKFLDVTDPSSPTCSPCSASCKGCLGQADNCSACHSPKVLQVDPQTGKNRCREITLSPPAAPSTSPADSPSAPHQSSSNGSNSPNQPSRNKTPPKSGNCSKDCLSCESPSLCFVCQDSKCVSLRGKCFTCPDGGILGLTLGKGPGKELNAEETKTMTWYAYQRTMNDNSDYLLAFSEEVVLLEANKNLKRIPLLFSVELQGYKVDEHFTYNAVYNIKLKRIEIELTFLQPIERTIMIFRLAEKNKFQGVTGKKLSNSEYRLDFQGKKSMPKFLDSFVKSLVVVSKGGSIATIGTSGVAIMMGSFCSNSLSFLTKLIQIIEFTSLMELYNIPFDETLGRFLTQIREATDFKLTISFISRLTDNVGNSRATQWKGKLSLTGIKPYLLQEIGYSGIAMMIFYCISGAYLVFRCEIPTFITNARINLFNILLIDYLTISLRTLGHFPTESPHDLMDYLSYAAACFILGCFVLELIFMFKKINNPAFYSEKVNKTETRTNLKLQKLQETEKQLKGIFFEGIDKKAVSRSWFARCYNFFYILRFMVICVLIFNLQFLESVQVVVSLAFMLAFTATTIYQQCKGKLFESMWITSFRIIQEISMSLIMLLINVFAFDYWNDFVSPKTKINLIGFFISLLVGNIILEILSSFISLINLIIECCRTKSSKNGKKNLGSSKIVIKRNRGRRLYHQARRSKKNKIGKSARKDEEAQSSTRKHLVKEKQLLKTNNNQFGEAYKDLDLSFSRIVMANEKKFSIKTKRKKARQMGPGFMKKKSIRENNKKTKKIKEKTEKKTSLMKKGKKMNIKGIVSKDGGRFSNMKNLEKRRVSKLAMHLNNLDLDCIEEQKEML